MNPGRIGTATPTAQTENPAPHKGGNDYGTDQATDQRVLSPSTIKSARESIKILADDLAGNDRSDGQNHGAWKTRQNETARRWALKKNQTQRRGSNSAECQ
jgi:hypothetical protein